MEQISNTLMCTYDELNDLKTKFFDEGHAAGKREAQAREKVLQNQLDDECAIHTNDEHALEKDRDRLIDLNSGLKAQLAASQARETVLRSLVPRELPNNFIGFGAYYAEHVDKYAPKTDEMRKFKVDYINQCLEALTQPADDTALKAALANERARCIFECMRGDYEYKTAMECVADIRRMNDA